MLFTGTTWNVLGKHGNTTATAGAAHMTQLSRRGFAKSRGISEARVRALIADGTLASALTADGLLDSKKADALLAHTLTRPKAPERIPAALRSARQRKLRAQTRDALDELRELQSNMITVADAEAVNAPFVELIAASQRRLVDLAPDVAGLAPDQAFRLLDNGVDACFISFQAALEKLHLSRPPKPPDPQPDLDISPVALQALLTNVQAEILERQRMLAHGQMVLLDDLQPDFNERMAINKSQFVAIPGRVAQLVAVASAEEARTLLAREVEGALANLAVKETS